MSTIVYVSQTTLDTMREELTRLKTSGRSAIAAAISEAREKGDLRENAEYDAAKEAQGMHEAKIAHLESAVANARVLDTSDMDISKVTILSKIRIANLNTNKEVQYQLVSESEADFKIGKISITSPIGAGLLGKAVGEIAEVQVPAGIIKLRIEEISF
jgi:transcription elongation factor GreA